MTKKDFICLFLVNTVMAIIMVVKPLEGKPLNPDNLKRTAVDYVEADTKKYY